MSSSCLLNLTFRHHSIIDDRELSKYFDDIPLEESDIKKHPRKVRTTFIPLDALSVQAHPSSSCISPFPVLPIPLPRLHNKQLRPYFENLALLKEHYTEVDDLLRSSLPARIATSFRPAERSVGRIGSSGGGGGGGRFEIGNGNGAAHQEESNEEGEGEGEGEGEVDGYAMDNNDPSSPSHGHIPHPSSEHRRPSHPSHTDSHMGLRGDQGFMGRNGGSDRQREMEDEEEELLPASGEREKKRERMDRIVLNGESDVEGH